MNKMKMVVALGACVVAGAVFAGPHGPGGRGPGGFHGGPRPAMHHPGPVHHHGGFWGRGGCHFWPGFVGGVVGGIVGTAIAEPVVVTTPTVVAAPTVVTTPVVTTPVVTQTVVSQPVQTVQNVWVEGRYIDQVQANGTVIRVWQPGHYEQRTVIVQ